MSIELREKLDELLYVVENGSADTMRDRVAWIIDMVPKNITEINKNILVIDKPKLACLVGKWRPMSRNGLTVELGILRKREDLIGRISDIIYRLAFEEEECV